MTRPLVTVGGLIIAPDGEILLVQSKKWKDLYSIPGGKVELGETREEAFRREIWEETHLEITNIHFVMAQDCIFSPEYYKEAHFVMNDFIAYLHPNYTKDRVQLNEESHHFRWISPDKAIMLPLHKECRHLIEWYLKNFKKDLAYDRHYWN